MLALQLNKEPALYQVALELPGVPDDYWPFSSVKSVSQLSVNHIDDK